MQHLIYQNGVLTFLKAGSAHSTYLKIPQLQRTLLTKPHIFPTLHHKIQVNKKNIKNV